jgi:hypothetical protein
MTFLIINNTVLNFIIKEIISNYFINIYGILNKIIRYINP